MAKLKSIPQQLSYVLGGQWTRDITWTAFTIILARHSASQLGQIMLALSFGYIVRQVADVGLNHFLISSFARKESRPLQLLSEITWLKLALLTIALTFTWFFTGWQNYSLELRFTVMAIAGGLGLEAVVNSFFALCQARGRQDVEMRIKIPSSLIGIGTGIVLILCNAPVAYIALYKPLESLLLIAISVHALGRNPLGKLNLSVLRHIGEQWRKGLIFTAISACAIFYNKLNVFFLKKYGGDEAVGAYSVAWEVVDGLSILVSSALLAKVVYPHLAKLWDSDKLAFQKLAGQTTRTLWAACMPVIYIICVESDRILTLIYGDNYAIAVTAQRILTPCIATAFLHNLAAYAMMSMRKQKLLLLFYSTGLAVNIILCTLLTAWKPLEGAALAITLTKVWVAIGTVAYFQIAAKPMQLYQWGLVVAVPLLSFGLWWFLLPHTHRLIAEITGLIPLLILFWVWRPPSAFEKQTQLSPEQ